MYEQYVGLFTCNEVTRMVNPISQTIGNTTLYGLLNPILLEPRSCTAN